ncbi:spinster family MFS transporter [Paludisphaera borealis]|uniref:Hexuronate transporter n=1 Tax=Paludisphaera borealis TaxID=1387353 RepID=A0A1U7CPG7_9BACT|nr:MFS transporter [Paludisphaera borealis]APW60835.1 Hexuronate transporter [Paludisphaera borealis]MDR3622524.1 MFS transporter [Paludisphaera borealis]
MPSPPSSPVGAASVRKSFLPTIGGPYFALAVLFGMNLLNYIDRYSFFAVGTQIKEDFKIDDFWYSVLGVSFMIVYTMVSPVIGWMGDRYNRRMLLAGGVGLWSLATVGTAFSLDFNHMFFWRALLGVGEASYGVIAPTLIADLFPVSKRGRAMGIYYLALPLGGALGYGLGSWIGEELGWQKAFMIVGFPGLIAAFLALVIHDPGRGTTEGGHETEKSERPGLAEYLNLFKIPTYVFNTAGMAAITFATGAYAVHGANFYQIVRGMTMKEAGMSIGGLTALAGLLGIALGTFLADFSLRFTKRAYLLLATIVTTAAVPLGLMAVLEADRAVSLSLLFGAMILLSMVLGPCNTVIANVVPANKRASGFALYIFLIHVFGDISSPLILGWISTFFGKPSVAGSWVGKFFASIGAAPIGDENLTVAMLVVAPVLALGAVFFLLGSRYLPRDQEQVLQAGGAGVGEPVFHH